MNQKHFAWLQRTALEYIGPDREEGLRQTGRFRHGEALGNRQTCGLGHSDIFGVTAAMHQRAYLIAHFKAIGAAAYGGDGAGHFQAWQL